MIDGHDCDGFCISCDKPTCEFCGQVSDEGKLYCNDCPIADDFFDCEEE